MFKIQPASFTDHLTEDGTELTRRPYPVIADADGAITGSPQFDRVIGFVADLAKQEITLRWREATSQVGKVPGMYVVVSNGHGWATLTTAVETFEELA